MPLSGRPSPLGLRAVVVDNAAAVRLYLRQGFAHTGEVSGPAPDGRREARMLRPLA